MTNKYKCKVEWCDRKRYSKDFCTIHLKAYKKHGDPNKTIAPERGQRKKITFNVDEQGCFVCTSHYGNPYRTITIGGKIKLMHRFIYEEMFGVIPEKMVVRHKCDNPACINPEHLELGTTADNNRDTRDRGRENITFRKFTKEQAKEIIRRIESGEEQTKLAQEYRVSLSTINHIKTGRNYKRLLSDE